LFDPLLFILALIIAGRSLTLRIVAARTIGKNTRV
jgi:hypothetical protein